MDLNTITERIIGAAIEVHKVLGPVLMESACEECLCRELALRGIRVDRQLPLPVEYKGVRLDCGYPLDLLVEQSVVVEVKSLSSIEPIPEAQLLLKEAGTLFSYWHAFKEAGCTREELWQATALIRGRMKCSLPALPRKLRQRCQDTRRRFPQKLGHSFHLLAC